MNEKMITFIYVSDLDRSDRFYRGQLGLVPVTRQSVCTIYRVNPGAYLGVCTHRPPTAPGSLIITLVRDDVEDYCDALRGAGVIIDDGPSHNESFGITHAFLRDPDDNVIEIQRFDDPTWADPLPDAASSS